MRAGLKDFRFHDLRHTWASFHRQAGTSCDELKDLGGWKSRVMVDRYAKFSTTPIATPSASDILAADPLMKALLLVWPDTTNVEAWGREFGKLAPSDKGRTSAQPVFHSPCASSATRSWYGCGAIASATGAAWRLPSVRPMKPD